MFLPHLKHFPDVFRQPVDPESMPSTIPTATWGQDSSCLMVYGITNKRHGGPISWYQRSHHWFFFSLGCSGHCRAKKSALFVIAAYRAVLRGQLARSGAK